MTDNEIIKAMECVIGNDVNCSECTYQRVLPFPSCRRMCAKNALDLINRQKAKNESLKVDLAKYSIRLDNLYKTADEIKSEAIKEFAHFVIDRSRNGVIYTSDIPDLVKEMTEIETNQRKEDEGK